MLVLSLTRKRRLIDLRLCLHISPDEDKVIDVESLDHQYPIIEWQSFFLTTKPQHDQTKPDEDIYLNKDALWGDLMICLIQGEYGLTLGISQQDELIAGNYIVLGVTYYHDKY
ncbi:hypothetical protein Tco_0545308 [Tanacetum coccineum]